LKIEEDKKYLEKPKKSRLVNKMTKNRPKDIGELPQDVHKQIITFFMSSRKLKRSKKAKKLRKN